MKNTQKPRKTKKRLVNVMTNKRAPFMRDWAEKDQGFGHSRNKGYEYSRHRMS